MQDPKASKRTNYERVTCLELEHRTERESESLWEAGIEDQGRTSTRRVRTRVSPTSQPKLPLPLPLPPPSHTNSQPHHHHVHNHPHA